MLHVFFSKAPMFHHQCHTFRRSIGTSLHHSLTLWHVLAPVQWTLTACVCPRQIQRLDDVFRQWALLAGVRETMKRSEGGQAASVLCYLQYIRMSPALLTYLGSWTRAAKGKDSGHCWHTVSEEDIASPQPRVTHMCERGCTDNDAICLGERRVVLYPAQRHLCQSEAMLVGGLFGGVNGIKIGVAEVALLVHLADARRLVEAAAVLNGGVGAFARQLSRQESAGEWVVDDDAHAVLAQAGDELLFNGTRDAIVHGLVYARHHPAVVARCDDTLGHLPGGKVAQTQPLKLALAMERVERLQRLYERRGAVRPVQIERADARYMQHRQRRLDALPQLLGAVRTGLIGVRLGVDGTAVQLHAGQVRLCRSLGIDARRVQLSPAKCVKRV